MKAFIMLEPFGVAKKLGEPMIVLLVKAGEGDGLAVFSGLVEVAGSSFHLKF